MPLFSLAKGRHLVHCGRVWLASELTSRGASTTDVMRAGNWEDPGCSPCSTTTGSRSWPPPSHSPSNATPSAPAPSPTSSKPDAVPHVAYRDAATLRAGLQVEPDPRQVLGDYLTERVVDGTVHNRASVVTALEEAGLEVTRQGEHYVTVRDSETGNRWRLKGALYEHDFDRERFAQQDPTEAGDRESADRRDDDSTGEPGAGNRHAGFGERGEETCLRVRTAARPRKRRTSHRALPVTRLPSTLHESGWYPTRRDQAEPEQPRVRIDDVAPAPQQPAPRRRGDDSATAARTRSGAPYRSCCRASGSDVFWTAVDRSH